MLRLAVRLHGLRLRAQAPIDLKMELLGRVIGLVRGPV